ncbi:unnamed protein product [Malus baccata var. baccata]
MASAISGRPLRFLTSRSPKHPPHKWNQINNSANASVPALRFVVPNLHNPHPLPLRPPLSLCLPPLLPRPPLSSLLGPCPPPLRHSLPLMTTSQAAASDSSQSSSSAKTVRLVIKGRVQGVFYRDWTVGNATELGLKGWVRNRRDGSVETLLSGNPDAVKEMEQRCRRGPPSAVVTGLEVFPSTEDPGTGFERKQTV